jgi:flagellar protein FlbD
MVTLTRMTGAQFALNPDLIERVDCTPDTVITLVDGTKYIVLETLAEVVAAVRDFRAAVIGAAGAFEHGAETPARRGRLIAVPAADAVRPDGHDRRDVPGDRAGGAHDLDEPGDGPVVPLTPRSL